MRGVARGARRAAFGLALIWAGACAPPAEELTFRFAPPDGREWDHESNVRIVADLPGLVDEEMRILSRSVDSAGRESSWTVSWTERLQDLRFWVDGRELFPGLGREIEGVEIVTEVMEDGDVTSVRGVERVEAILAQRAAADGLDPEAFANDLWARREAERAAWRERVGALAGKTVRLGEPIESTALFDFGADAPLSHRVLLTPRETRACGDTTCAAIVVEYRTDPDAVAPYLGVPAARLYPEAEPLGDAVTIEGIEVSGEGERLVEIATLLVREERTEKKVRLTLRGPQQRLEIVVTTTERGTTKPRA